MPQANAAKPKDAAPGSGQATPQQVRVQVLDQRASQQMNVRGLGLALTNLDPEAAKSSAVSVRLDYQGFASAYGGDWASRLRLVTLPACAATTPQRPECQVQTPLKTTNDVKSGTLTAEVSLPATPAAGRPAPRAATPAAVPLTLAATAGPSGPSGDYKATALSPSATWDVSTQTGSFGWDYPMRAPPVPGGPAPTLKLAYSSGGVDGRTSSTNNQASWIGEGFDYWPGYIERRYRSCADDGVTPKRADNCWRYDNAVLTLNGNATELVRDDATGGWKPKRDDGMKIEKLTGADNDDDNGEHWKVTTPDGVQYFFGLNHLPGWTTGKTETNSAWTVPVFGNNSGEPCNKASGFDASWCQQAWRWNLDYVVDPHGTASTFWYGKETNYYQRNTTTLTDGKPNGTPTEYVRGGYLRKIGYGQRGDLFGQAPAQVLFSNVERCKPTSSFDCAENKLNAANAAHWPDVPFDQNCASGTTCTGNYAPSFWTRKMLDSITTQVLSGTTTKNADTWKFEHKFLTADYGKADTLWLDTVQHIGKNGGSEEMPAVKFGGIQLDNRVDSSAYPPMAKWRISTIDNETGGSHSISYSDKDCTPADYPSIGSNHKRCFPQYWTPEGGDTPQRDWFHKYVVTAVHAYDRVGGGLPEVTTYAYKDAAWHHDDDDGLSPEKYKTWSQWRGFGEATVTHGDGSERRSQTKYLYFQGMDGDEQPDGSTRKASVTDSEGKDVTDAEPLAGQEREEIHYNGPGGDEMTGTITDVSVHQTAKRVRSWGTTTADRVYQDKVRTRRALDGGRWRRTETDNTYDGYGMVSQVNDQGDTSTTADDRCTRTTYARDDDKWLVSYASREETVAKACGASTTRPGDVITDTRKFYDGQSWNVAPTKGDVTKTDKLDGFQDGSPRYVTVATNPSPDPYGRPTTVTDQAGRKTVNAYTPTTGVVTAATVTDPANFVTKTEVDPAFGLSTATVDENGKRTSLKYDPLGRLTDVWLPGRATTQSPSLKFGYTVSLNAPTVVSTSTLRTEGAYTTGYALYDGQLRPRQTQEPAPGGGRLVSDTIYDTRGLVAKTNNGYYNETSPGGTLFVPASDDVVPAQTVNQYDGMEWKTAEIFRVGGNEKWRTSTVYGGDRTTVTLPQGGTKTTTIVDARGQKTEVDQYKDATHFDATKYTYEPDGQPATITDAAGSTWTYHYDQRGRPKSIDDPDRGTTSFVYDDATDLIKTVTDAKNQSITYTHDVLGRRTGEYSGTGTGGTKLAEWTYDTLADGTSVKGKPASSTRWVNGQAYKNEVLGYDDAYRTLSSKLTIPTSETGLGGTYKTTSTYNLDGTPHQTVLPAGGQIGSGGLPSETLLYGYDELGNPTTLHGLTWYVTNTSYSKLGQKLQQTYSTGGKRVQETNYYEQGTNRLTRTTTQREVSPTPVGDLNYTYNDIGDVKRIADTPTGQTTDVQCFAHDHLQRLTDAWTPSTDDCATTPTASNANSLLGGAQPYWQSFGYDLVGNRTSETNHDLTGDTTKDVNKTYRYPGAGQSQPHTLTSVSYQGGPRDGQTDAYGYDGNGNTTTRPGATAGQTLSWDIEGHLSKITEGGADTTFLYDADGNQLIRRDPDGSATLAVAGTEVRYAKPTGKSSATRYYTLGDDTVASRTTAGLTWLRSDPHNSADISIAESTQEVTHRRFTPFGQARGTKPTNWQGERGFVGGTINGNTGLTTLGARQYDPDTGRFVSVDPVFDGSNPQSWNGYAYAGNNPVTNADPSGLMFDHPGCGWSCGEGVGSGGGDGGGGGGGGGPAVSPPAPAPQHCGRWDFGCKAKNLWNEHKAVIVTVTVAIVVTAGCEVATGGFGTVGCAVAGGAAGNLAGYAVSNKPDKWTAGGAAKQAVIGGVGGAVGWGIGRGAGALLGKLAGTAAGRVVGGAVGKAAGSAKTALGRGTSGAAGRAASRAGAKRGAQTAGRCLNSFPAGTMVLLANGSSKPIEKVKVGDKVTSTDPKTGKTTTKNVIAAFGGTNYTGLFQITVAGGKHRKAGVILATEHHRFWDAGHHTWTRVDHLKPGTKLRTPTGETRQVTRTIKTTTHPYVHDLTIADTHTFYVKAANASILVHNCDGVSPELAAHAKSVQRKLGDGEQRVATIMRAPDGAIFRSQSRPREIWDLEEELTEAMLEHQGAAGLHHAGCGEVGCLNRALSAEGGRRTLGSLSGSRFESAIINGRRGAITPVPPCDDWCAPLLRGLGMTG
ncbi:polymorphic toxin-type HINT domain-containing protein [Actinomadura rubrisoli]|uniref:Hint domain-containing protein n=1 Tax=Actinomadura rubrisoli TaxID=2530368 RepID=A0A4R5BN62_9ACTN|nr:polymorphic toxin-type HINT domain-containing protein [Actinomadura rubrisoli]TDD85392.1 hypothetical protein E1298_18670 [Actinomadura rubrisoli]